MLPEPLVWTTPSDDSSGSMPLGNGDIGVNVWVEQNGDLLFYLSKTDAWDENARLLKLGRIRVSFHPSPFIAGAGVFLQNLDLASGAIRIKFELGSQQSSILVWVDANRPVVRVEVSTIQPCQARIALELWREEQRFRGEAEGHFPAGLRSSEDREMVYPDRLLAVMDDAVLWCHRNVSSCWAATLEHQDMADWKRQGRDPLRNRTFGAMLRGQGLVRDGDRMLRTPVPSTRMAFGIHLLTAQTETVEEWVDVLGRQADLSDAMPLDQAFDEHTVWWHAFWNRSWIHISGTPEAETVSRGYELQRFVTACGGRGAYPIKFNGSIFTVDSKATTPPYDADYRRWGGGYWFQNTRLMYWAMIMSGDFDMMEPLFKLYLDALPLATERARKCFGIEDAAVFPETMTFWGAFLNRDYGYHRAGCAPGISENTYIHRYWQGMLELLAIILDAYAVSGDDRLVQTALLVLAPPFLRFYCGMFPRRDDSGKMIISPSQSLETWHVAVNPSPDIAGLRWVLNGLLSLPDRLLPEELRKEWQALRDLIPPLPTRTYRQEKRTVILPALQYDQTTNRENPELYAIFPYRIFGVGKSDLDIGIATWEDRRFVETGGWQQEAIHAAMLGRMEEAKSAVVKNFSTSHAGSRFPAFWGPNFDWTPDQSHGSVAAIALQQMLMQYDGADIRLLPAWPRDWRVEFKLYAPGGTLVEGRAGDGGIQELRVTPETRRSDVHMAETDNATGA